MLTRAVLLAMLTVGLSAQEESREDQQARWAQERRETVRATASPDPATRMAAVLELRRQWQPLPWQLLAQTFDPARPHLPADLRWPTTASARVEIWLAAARRCPAEPEPYQRQYPWRLGPSAQLANDCLHAAAGEGVEAQLRLLEVAADGGDDRPQRNVMRMFVPTDAWGRRTFSGWLVTEDPRAEPLLLRLSLAADEEVVFAALALIEQVFERGATDAELIRSICDRARQALRERGELLAYGPNVGPGCGNSIRFYGPIANAESLLVAAASYAGLAAPQQELVAHCEPFLKQPGFGRPRSDFAWHVLLHNAPDLAQSTRQRLDRLVLLLPAQSIYEWDVERMRAALRGERAPRPPRPQALWQHLPQTLPYDRELLEQLSERAPIAGDDLRSMQRVLQNLLGYGGTVADICRALALSATCEPSRHEFDQLWCMATQSRDAAVRVAAYEAMLTRDAATSEMPWLVHETVFDPSPEVRALAARAPR